VQPFGFGRRHLILQHLVLGAQLVNQGDYLFDLRFKRFEFRIHGPHYSWENAAWSRTKPLFSKWFIGSAQDFSDAAQQRCM
jgi:hypothetical protein